MSTTIGPEVDAVVIVRTCTTEAQRVIRRVDLEQLLEDHGNLEDLTADELRDAISAELDRGEACFTAPISWTWLERHESITDGTLTVRPAKPDEATFLDDLAFD
jgi:hypothetical protein